MLSDSVQVFLSLALGFAVAGLVCSGYRLATHRLPSFRLLSAAPRGLAVAAVPLIIIAAPFLIMRNTLLGTAGEANRFAFVFMATVVAGFWSLMSGTALVVTLQLVGVIAA